MARELDSRRIEVIDDATVQIMRRMTGAERVAHCFKLLDSARGIIESSVRNSHPDWSDSEVRGEVIRRSLGVQP